MNAFESWVMANEPLIRMGFFFGVFALVALWALAPPRRALKLTRQQRWTANLGIVLLNTVIVRLLFPAAAVGMAALGVEKGWGLLNNYAVPFWLAVPLAVVAMEFVIWLQHVMVHAVPALWRLHRVHHADLDYDLTTGAMFNHGNIRLPAALDRALRWFIVTPDMHRVHHSVEDDESNSNFGFNLTWWDRLFGTYREQPRAGQLGMTIGIHGHTDPHEGARLPGMLALPFKGQITDYAINRRPFTEPGAGASH